MNSQFKEFWNEFTRDHGSNDLARKAAEGAWNAALERARRVVYVNAHDVSRFQEIEHLKTTNNGS